MFLHFVYISDTGLSLHTFSSNSDSASQLARQYGRPS